MGGGEGLRHAACGILVPQPGIEPTSPALEARSLNCWTSREVPKSVDFKLSQLTSIMWVGLIQSVESLNRKRQPPWKKREFCKQMTFRLTTALPWVSSLLACLLMLDSPGLHNYVSKFLKTNLSIDTDRDTLLVQFLWRTLKNKLHVVKNK